MKTLIIILLTAASLFAQSYTVTKVRGDVKYQTGADENWIELSEGTELNSDAIILTGENSSVQLKNESFHFTFKEESAVSVSSIKKLTLDELLLALAMEDMINAPKNKNNTTSSSTAVYGTEESGTKTAGLNSSDFGIKRLNGAVQLADNGLQESAVIAAKETYRKYPFTKKLPSYRILFADILFEKGLYEESLEEYNDIIELDLNEKEKENVEKHIEQINKILLSE